ncbi:MAG TPA: protease modulator HflK [Candidatus Limnocylindria bacterium]|jgi:membrane protease subunit HflK|nr:protease modulator HflK [Candidatus Limnocylindria bacterium]
MADPKPNSGNLKLTPAPVTSLDDASSQALNEALGSSFLVVRLLMFGLLAAFVISCIVTVKPNEVAVVLRFGKPVGTGPDMQLKPGLHWALPAPIDEVVSIPVGESKSVRAKNAWFAISPEEEAAGVLPAGGSTLRPGVDGHTLTSDGNILHVRATMKYRISDPVAYTFQFHDVTNTLVNFLNNAIYHASARFTADAALYKERTAFTDAIRERLATLVERANLGIALEPLDVEVSAPLYVRDAFDEVIKAEQDRSKKISEARGFFDETVRKAEGEASAIRSSGLVVSNSLVQAVGAEAKFFLDALPIYDRNPALFRERVRVEAVTQVLTNAPDKFFLPARADGHARELRIQLNREPISPVNKPKAQ